MKIFNIGSACVSLLKFIDSFKNWFILKLRWQMSSADRCRIMDLRKRQYNVKDNGAENANIQSKKGLNFSKTQHANKTITLKR